MNLPSSELASIRWSAIFPWLLLVRAARVALMARVILLALLGVAATYGGWRLIDSSFGLQGELERLEVIPRPMTPPLLLGEGQAERFGSLDSLPARLGPGAVYSAWEWLGRPFGELARASAPRAMFLSAVAGLWSLAVWALFGGAIARIAALYLTYGETLGPLAAIRTAARTWPSAVGALAMVALATAVVALPLVAAGWLLRFDLIVLPLGLAWAFALLAGVIVALFAVGLACGWPLMWSTVAVERTDAFDAISRGFAYLYQRPLHLLFYLMVATLLGLFAQLAVDLATEAAILATERAVSIGVGRSRLLELSYAGQSASGEVDRIAEIGVGGMDFWTNVVRSAATYFPLAYFWPALTGVYLLLRRQIDGVELTEVVFDEGEARTGLPPLAASPLGVPQVDHSATGSAKAES